MDLCVVDMRHDAESLPSSQPLHSTPQIIAMIKQAQKCATVTLLHRASAGRLSLDPTKMSCRACVEAQAARRRQRPQTTASKSAGCHTPAETARPQQVPQIKYFPTQPRRHSPAAGVADGNLRRLLSAKPATKSNGSSGRTTIRHTCSISWPALLTPSMAVPFGARILPMTGRPSSRRTTSPYRTPPARVQVWRVLGLKWKNRTCTTKVPLEHIPCAGQQQVVSTPAMCLSPRFALSLS
jgi:hypothetical protein